MENAAESKWQDGFGKRLQMVREKMGISRKALAERLMIPVYHLEAIEEKGLPISKTLKEMAQKELNIDDKNGLWLWTGTGEMPNLEALPQAAEDTLSANNVQAFCHERPIAECLYYAMEDCRQDGKHAVLGYALRPDSEVQQDAYMNALKETRLSRTEYNELTDHMMNTENDLQMIFYLHGMADGLRLLMEAVRASDSDEDERRVFHQVLEGCGVLPKGSKTASGKKRPEKPFSAVCEKGAYTSQPTGKTCP